MYKFLGLVAATLIVLPAASWAQGMGSQGMGGGMASPPSQQPQQQQGQQGQTGQKPATPAAAPTAPVPSPAEEAAWKKLSNTSSTDASAVAKEAEDFLKKYNADPTKPSLYADRVYAELAAAYMQLPGEQDKMFAALRQSLTLNQNNVDALALMSMANSRRIKADQPNAAAVETATEAMAKHGIELLTAVQKPDGISDTDFARNRDEKLAMCHSGLGRVEQLQGKDADAAQEFAMAVKLETPPDPVDQYLLGISLLDSKQASGAVTAFQDCLKDPGPMMQGCTGGLAEAKKAAATQISPKQ